MELPPHWSEITRLGEPLNDSLPIVLLKVPLETSLLIKSGAPASSWFTPSMLVNGLNYQSRKITLLVDLCEKSYFADTSQFEKLGVGYVHVPWPHVLPLNKNKEYDVALLKRAVKIIAGALKGVEGQGDHVEGGEGVGAVIGICCEDGYNKAGFAAVSYLCEYCDTDLKPAIQIVKDARPPGILKQDFMDSLYQFYGNPKLATAYDEGSQDTNNIHAGSDTVGLPLDAKSMDSVPIAPSIKDLPNWAKPKHLQTGSDSKAGAASINSAITSTETKDPNASAILSSNTSSLQSISPSQAGSSSPAAASAVSASSTAATGATASGRKLPSHVRKALAAQQKQLEQTSQSNSSTGEIGLGEKKQRPDGLSDTSTSGSGLHVNSSSRLKQ